jgi:hypothetical protein
MVQAVIHMRGQLRPGRIAVVIEDSNVHGGLFAVAAANLGADGA